MNEKVTGIVEKCDTDSSSWHFVHVPKNISVDYKDFPKNTFGFIAITAKVGNSIWSTSLLPSGDKETYFIALPAKIRKAEAINIGDRVTIEFDLRERE